MTEIEKETGMTDAECECLDEYFTKNPYVPGPNLLKLGIKPGSAHKYLPLLKELDNDVVEYLCKQGTDFNKTYAEVINDLVHEKLAVGVAN